MPTVRQDFLNRMSSAAEADGWAPIAGRLFGSLLLSPEPRSLDELADELGVSKASVSIDARHLLERGIVDRVCRAGDRRDYYTLSPDFCSAIIEYRLRRWRGLQRLATEARQHTPALPAAVRQRIALMDDFHQFVIDRVTAAMAEWETRNAAAPAARRAQRQVLTPAAKHRKPNPRS
jgi:DNA-binding MarR family transcriptional regulator